MNRGAGITGVEERMKEYQASSTIMLYLAARYPTSQPEEPDNVGAPGAFCGAVAPRAQGSSSVSPSALRRPASAVRAGCANQRQSRSVRGALGNQRPYRDLSQPYSAHLVRIDDVPSGKGVDWKQPPDCPLTRVKSLGFSPVQVRPVVPFRHSCRPTG